MSSVFNKIADAVTGHHTQADTTNTGNSRTNSGSTTNARSSSALNPSGNQAGGVGNQYAGTNYSAADNGALKEGSQVRDTGMNSAARATGATASSGLGSDKHNNANSGSTLGHSTTSGMGSTATGAALGSGLGSTGTTTAGTGYGTAGSRSSNFSSSTTGGSIGAQGREGVIDDAMTRSEEHLLVGKEKVNVGKAALHKYVTTEKVSTAVPIIRERAVVEREPITDANRDAAMRGPDFKEAHYEVNLHEERAIAEKEEVPIERVRLRKEVEQTQQYVEADLRKEHIELVDNTRALATGASATGTGIGNSTDFNSAKTFDNSVGTGKTFDSSATGTNADLSGTNQSGSRLGNDMKAGRRAANAMDTRP